MLTVINLYTIDKIFENAKGKLSPMTKMIYINCLMHYFRDKKSTVANAVAFELFEEDFKDYEKFKKNMQELHKAGLVTIGIKSIVFNNMWGQYIDRRQLEKVNVEEFVAGFSFREPKAFKEELLKSGSLYELCSMKYKLGKGQVQKLIDIFILEQTTAEKTYQNFSDCIKHFSNWAGKNTDQAPKEIVKSTGKILGL